MRIIGKLAVGLLILVAILAATAFLLPREIEVSRSIVINAPAEKIFPHVNNLRKWDAWSPWAKMDPDAVFEYSGSDQGVGQEVTWRSDRRDVGNGSQKITQSIANKRVSTALDFGDMGTATAAFQFEPEGSSTRVTWGFETDTGNNPLERWFGLMMDKWIGGAYEQGLDNLKSVAEQS